MTREGYLKHKDLIEAWVNGADIEYFVDVYKYWDYTEAPLWREEIEYRIKPKQTIAEWLEENNSDYVPDWKNVFESKFYVAYDYSQEAWFIDYDVLIQCFGVSYMKHDTALELQGLLNEGKVIL